MNKLLRLFLVILSITACQDIDIDTINSRLDNIENSAIATINQQIAAINTSLPMLQSVDVELKTYINALEKEVKDLTESLSETNTKIDDLKKELLVIVSEEKDSILAELEALKSTINNDLEVVNNTLELLKEKDSLLEEQIAELQIYVDAELSDVESWVASTFATLEQYNAITASIVSVESLISNLDNKLTDLESSLIEKIARDIEAASNALSDELQASISALTSAYTSAIAAAADDIRAAYTSDLETSIAACEQSMKTWVNEQLTGYYTIAEIEAKITIIQAAITDGNEVLQQELNALTNALNSMNKSITDAYIAAITEAITNNNGIIDEKIAAEISSINEDISLLKTRIDTLEDRLLSVENDIINIQEQLTNLVNKIQSISYIPTYDDGKATIDTNGKFGVFDFQISPKSAVVQLAEIWKEALSMKAIYAQTRAISFIDLPITFFDADLENGTICIEVDASNLNSDFFSGAVSLNTALYISDGNTECTSDFINAIPGNAVSPFKPANNEIWYTTSDENIIKDIRTTAFNTTLISHTYNNGKGIITFNKDITSVGSYAFYNCSTLETITLPNAASSIGDYTFYGCSNLESIAIPNTLSSIGDGAFRNCTSLLDIDIPQSVSSIGAFSFFGCVSLPTIDDIRYAGSCAAEAVDKTKTTYKLKEGTRFISSTFENCYNLTDFSIPSSIIEIGDYAFCMCTSLSFVTIPDSMEIIGKGAFYGCESLVNITIPESVTQIKGSAFSSCSSLLNVKIPDKVKKIEGNSFDYCTSLVDITIGKNVYSIEQSAFNACTKLTNVFCKASTPPTGYYNMFDSSTVGVNIYVPSASIKAYQSAATWSKYASNIKGYSFE